MRRIVRENGRQIEWIYESYKKLETREHKVNVYYHAHNMNMQAI